MHAIVIYNHYLHAPIRVVGLFDSRHAANVWMNENDRWLAPHESMAVHELCKPELVFGR